MRIQVIDQNRRPVMEDGHLGIDLDDEMTERYHELGEFLKMNSLAAVGKRYGARDALDPIAFLQGQLTYLEKKSYETDYTKTRYEDLLGPVISSEAGENAVNVSYEVVDYTGVGQRHAPDAKDMPLADTASSRIQMPVAEGWIGYKYTFRELRLAASQNMPLPMRKQEAAIRAWRRHMDNVALSGEAISNFTGFYSNGSVTATARPSGAVWDAATPLTMLSDINSYINTINDVTDGNHIPSHLALPAIPMGRLLTPDPAFPNRSVMEWLQANNMYTLITGKPFTIVPGGKKLDTAGSGSTRRGVFYTPDLECMILHEPLPVRFAMPVPGILEMIVPAEYGYGGHHIRRIETVRYMDNI